MSICLVDFSGVYRRHWAMSEGEDTYTAARKTVEEITALAGQHEYVGLCVDRPPYKRKEQYPEYKANRDKTPAVCHEMADKALAELAAAGFPVFGVDGAEADDVIATMVDRISSHGEGRPGEFGLVLLYSSDKDLHYLVGEYVKQYSPARNETIGPEYIKERYGIEPSQIPDYLALVGDKSDNIPGVPGVGDKTATKLLQQFGCIEGIMEAAAMGKLSEKGAKALEEANPARWLALTTLDDSLEIDIAPLFQQRKPKEVPVTEPEIIASEPESHYEPLPPLSPAETRAAPEKATTAIVARDRDSLSPYAIEPTTPGEAWNLAQRMVGSRAFGSYPNPEAALAVIMAGRARGIDAITSLLSFHLIKGKISPSTQMLIALVKRSQVCEYFQLVESTTEKAVYTTKRKGDPEPTRYEYTYEEAQAAGLTNKDNWKSYRREMLRARCAAALARIVYPDITTGFYTEEEMRDA